MTAIFGMAARALNRFKTTSTESFLLVFFGSVLFVLSDTLIAIDKFYVSIPNDGVFVMSTYIAAQYLIMRGILQKIGPVFLLFCVKLDHFFNRFLANRTKMFCYITFHPTVDKRTVNTFA